MILDPFRKVLSFQYDDSPMDDHVYEFHARWIKWLHDYYLRVDHLGSMSECLSAARKERVILISNHALTIEACIICYILYAQGAGHVGTLVFREAFKLPLVREFFRSCQCIPISVDSGAKTLAQKHVLIFPEGMDFLSGLTDPERMPDFHSGFLRIAHQYMKETKRKSVTIVPVAHAGIEKMLRFWVVKNETVMNTLVRPLVKYPFWVVPKLPFFLPSKVVVNWGKPVRITRDSLNSPQKIHRQAERFKGIVRDLRKIAQYQRDRTTWNLAPAWEAIKNFNL